MRLKCLNSREMGPSTPDTFDRLRTRLNDDDPNFYTLLALTKNASSPEIKAAYHRALLRHHPDKNRSTTGTNNYISDDQYTVTVIQKAYTTLSDPLLRAIYDSSERMKYKPSKEQRPAELVSLDEFEAHDGSDDAAFWTYPCRCGSAYRIDEKQMDQEVHLIGCQGCSEAVWVGYEVADPDQQNPKI